MSPDSTAVKLQSTFARNPEFDLLSVIPYDYEPLYTKLKPPLASPSTGEGAGLLRGPDLRGTLNPQDTVSTLFFIV